MIRLFHCPRDQTLVAHTREDDVRYVQQLLECAVDRETTVRTSYTAMVRLRQVLRATGRGCAETPFRPWEI